MSDPSDPTELVYARRTRVWGEWFGGVTAERWEVSDTGGALVMSIVETDLTPVARALRLWNPLFVRQKARRLAVLDRAGRELFSIDRPRSTLRADHADLRSPDGEPYGMLSEVDLQHYPPRPETVQRLPPPRGIGLFDPRQVRLAEIGKSRPFGATREVHATDGTEIATFTATREGMDGYRLRLRQPLAEPLRSLVLAAPVVAYFMRVPV